ncbi:MAG: ABC transporter permease [Bacteroidales bacterium]|nr:ABC transporter permease [Lachnoclostridium sp.]MCM1382910.1 ABC transporter permease [Lachnoclostridium sp.]MCM1465916.1 ABC transporter permease [Bacteroidales bacterium]
MDTLQKTALKGLQKNKKRTLVTLVGIILATALITAVANMAESFRASLILYQKNQTGDFHYCFQGVTPENLKYFKNNRNIEKIGYEKNLGYALLEGCINPDKPYVFVKAMDDNAMKAAALKLVKGRMPQTDEEIVISSHIRSNGNVDIAVGDVLELTIGYRDAGEGHILNQSNPYSYEAESLVGEETKTYTVVGIIERPSYQTIESYTAPGYTVVTFLEDGEAMEGTQEAMNIYAAYTQKALKNKEQVTAGLLGISEELYEKYYKGRLQEISDEEWKLVENMRYNLIENYYLVKWQLLDFSNGTLSMLYSMAAIAILIIIVTSAFCIHNSFMISLSEKMRFYGMLSSMGATKKQRRKMVYTEAACLGVIGIPIGVFCGAAAVFFLTKITAKLVMTAMDLELVYVVSVPAVIAGALLSIVMIFLSAGRAARKAGKLSPISAIRGSDTIKMKAKDLRTPKFIHRLFGMGGTIAYKNLRRSRGKYRTTVISIMVSVSVFIAMTTFIRLAFKVGDVYYEKTNYQLRIRMNAYSGENYKKALEILKMEGVTYGEAQCSLSYLIVPVEDIPFNAKYVKDLKMRAPDKGEAVGFSIVSLQEDAFEAYLKKVGADTAQAENKAVLAAPYGTHVMIDEKHSKYVEGMKYDYRPGDKITGVLDKGTDAVPDAEGKEEVCLELIAYTDIHPLGWSVENQGSGVLVVSDKWMEQYEDEIKNPIILYLQCEDAADLEIRLRNETGLPQMSIANEQQAYEENRATYLVIAIFLYGFIAVIALIGITNIFNTVTTNMELRSREFAMLRAIGMTDKEFQRMVQLESLFYGVKSLAIGIPLGILLSLCFHIALAAGIVTSFTAPIPGIVISIVAVFVLLYGIMRYSMGKIGQKNLIQTIQNENI